MSALAGRAGVESGIGLFSAPEYDPFLKTLSVLFRDLES
jgi:hypothetical protein